MMNLRKTKRMKMRKYSKSRSIKTGTFVLINAGILVFLHELGHIVMLLLFKIPVYGINFNPHLPDDVYGVFGFRFFYLSADAPEDFPFWQSLYALLFAPLVAQFIYLYRNDKSKYWIILCLLIMRYDILMFLRDNCLIGI
jgi:hypothetical protein